MKRILVAAICILNTLILPAQGIYQLWGMTPLGGADNKGTLFSTDAQGNNFRLKYQFDSLSNPGAYPGATQLIEYNGTFYGMTTGGGINGLGVIFEWDPATNVYTKKIDFDSTGGYTPAGSLSLSGGKFYAMTQSGGSNGSGVIFEWDPTTNVYIKKIDFDSINGEGPFGSLTLRANKFYGMTWRGGNNNIGVIFEWDPGTNVYTKKIDLNTINGSNPDGSLTLVGDKFYGMTERGGIDGVDGGGVIFEWDPATNVYTKKMDFIGTNGSRPVNSLTLFGGKLYGMTTIGGGFDRGVIFEWDPATNLFTKRIDLNPTDGFGPSGNLTLVGSKFYGLTASGGIYGEGVIFEWDPATNIYTRDLDFVSIKGSSPPGSLTLREGKLYGMTNVGGSGNSGVIFEWDPSGNAYSKKIDFYGNYGINPSGHLTQLGAKFYGMTSMGGSNDRGVIFEFDPATNLFTNKFDFSDSTGYTTYGRNSLVLNNGKLYGMTNSGGSNNLGVIFEWDPVANLFTKKIDFNGPDGSEPQGNLTFSGGKFYGLTYSAYANARPLNGVIFEWDPATNIYTKKIDLTRSNGGSPMGSLTLQAGKFYGMTSFGGSADYGVIFQWDPGTNLYTKKIDLDGPIGSGHPPGNLTFCDGKFYGMSGTPGLIFEWDPVSNVYNKKIDLDATRGMQPQGSLTLNGGQFFGMTVYGGSNNSGVIFKWDHVTNQYTKKKDFNGTDGQGPGDDLTLVQVPVATGLRGSCVSFPAVTIDNTNNNKWVSITDNEGNAVAEIKANGNNLGIVNSSIFINNASVREDGFKRLYLDRNITITPQVQPISAVDVRLYIKGSEYQALKNSLNSMGEPSGISSTNDLGIFKNENSCLPAIDVITNPVAATVAAWQEDYVLSANISSFSSFYFANKNLVVLPLTLLEFNARLISGNGILNWKTAGEQNTAGFEIERSIDGTNYAAVATVATQNTTGIHDYSFNDPRITVLGAAAIYYRLKQKDVNGRFIYSRIVALSIDQRSVVLFYPNPVKNKANLTVTINQPQQVKARVIDATGKVMSKKQWALPAGSTSLSVDVGRLAKGIYYLELNGLTINLRKQFNKQ